MTIRPLRIAATLSCALPLIWTACGGSDSPDAAPPPERPAAEAPTAAAPAAAAPTAPTAPKFAETEWKLVALEPSRAEAIVPVTGAVPTLRFGILAGPDGVLRMVGYSGCNRFFGDYTAGDDGSLSLSEPLGMTEMACPEPVMDLETTLMEALANASGYSLDGAELTIRFAGGSLRFSGG